MQLYPLSSFSYFVNISITYMVLHARVWTDSFVRRALSARGFLAIKILRPRGNGNGNMYPAEALGPDPRI